MRSFPKGLLSLEGFEGNDLKDSELTFIQIPSYKLRPDPKFYKVDHVLTNEHLTSSIHR